MIYFASDVSVRVEGGVWRRYTCSGCDQGYRFFVKKSVTRTRQAPYMLYKKGAERSAREAAEWALEDRFDNEFEPVPCPTCGEYQSVMVPAVCAERFRWIANCISAALCLSPMIFAGIAIGMYELLAMDKRKDDFLEDWLAVLIPALGVAVLPMILLKLYQQQKFTMFHPNIDVPIDERIALGKQLAEPIPANEARS